jgi:hypothetical protein
MVLDANPRAEQVPSPSKLALYDELYERQMSGN